MPATVPERRGADADWTVQTADTIERVVGSVRNKTTVPLTTVARGLVYGLLAAFTGMTALVLLAIAAVRLLTIALGEAWAAHLVSGAIFTLAGVLLLRKALRRPRERD